MMAGSRMTLDFDPKLGREAGSKITLRGNVLGIPLTVDEVVIERTLHSEKPGRRSARLNYW